MTVWERYRETYLGFWLSLSQSEIAAILAEDILRDFPNRLPPEWRAAFASALGNVATFRPQLRGIAAALSKAIYSDMAESLLERDKVRATDIEGLLQHVGGKLNEPAEPLCVALDELRLSPTAVDFERAIWSEFLVMTVAHVEAFLGDSLRAACAVRPEIMKSKKPLTWEDALSCNGWDGLVSHLTEQLVLELGMRRSIKERVEDLEKRLGIKVSTSADLGLLDEAESLRHIIMHNGGRASPEYLRRTERSDVAPGDPIPVTQEYVRKIAREARCLATALFSRVSTKFLGKRRNELPVLFATKVTAVVPPPPHQS